MEKKNENLLYQTSNDRHGKFLNKDKYSTIELK